jgi:hypothetical protein
VSGAASSSPVRQAEFVGRIVAFTAQRANIHNKTRRLSVCLFVYIYIYILTGSELHGESRNCDQCQELPAPHQSCSRNSWIGLHTHTHTLFLSLSLSHTHTHTHIYIYTYVCMHVWKYIYIYLRTYIQYVCMCYVCMYIYLCQKTEVGA